MRRFRIVEGDLFQVVAPSIADAGVWDVIAEFPSRAEAEAYIGEVTNRALALMKADCE